MNLVTIPSIATAAAALAFAGCGGGNDSNSGSSTGASATPSSGGGSATTVSAHKAGHFGKVLVDSKGVSLYLFKKDKGPKSTCSGACAAAWPPLTTQGKPKTASGAQAGQLGTSRRSDGKTQVTYNGHPLYYYAGDGGQPGSTSGQELDQFGAEWYLVSPKGQEVEGH